MKVSVADLVKELSNYPEDALVEFVNTDSQFKGNETFSFYFSEPGAGVVSAVASHEEQFHWFGTPIEGHANVVNIFICQDGAETIIDTSKLSTNSKMISEALENLENPI